MNSRVYAIIIFVLFSLILCDFFPIGLKESKVQSYKDFGELRPVLSPGVFSCSRLVLELSSKGIWLGPKSTQVWRIPGRWRDLWSQWKGLDHSAGETGTGLVEGTTGRGTGNTACTDLLHGTTFAVFLQKLFSFPFNLWSFTEMLRWPTHAYILFTLLTT